MARAIWSGVERTTDEVEYSDIVKGAETGGGHYVMLD
jgi:non-homologous end joining protein Ku